MAKNHETHLAWLEHCAAQIEQAHNDRDEAIRKAYKDEVPVNKIATAASLTRQRVHQIVSPTRMVSRKAANAANNRSM